MSQNHIKIFNDTVLKQSINQGTESQRMATNLGRFTSGELAFTRDTGRIFVGNKSSKSSDEIDMPEVLGGILAGNKYLGYIDSKPLSWWRGGEYGSLPLNYDSETYAGGETSTVGDKEHYTKESSMLGADSKYRNKVGKDGNKYEGKWERDAVYNKTYDAYNGDYLYDMYQNALILFDTNISEKRDCIQGIEIFGENENPREQFYDATGNKLKIDEQYRRTKIENIKSEYNKDHPVYGDGYVIFRNIEVDGKSIKFKDKVFNSDGSTDYDHTSDGFENYSHNIIEVGTISASSFIGSMADIHFVNKNETVYLKEKLKEIHEIKNSNNSITLPQIITLSSAVSVPTFKLDFSNTAFEGLTDMGTDDLTFKLTKNSFNEASYNVSIAKNSSKDLYIKLGEGLYNSANGNSSYIKLNVETAGTLNEETPTISLTDEENFYLNNNNLSDPFYINYNSDETFIYTGNLTLNASGIIQAIDEYDQNYALETVTEREKFESNENVKVNFLKNPIPITWNLKKTNSSTLSTSTNVNANLEFILKPYFYCITKNVVDENGILLTDTMHDNSLIVYGNNYHESLEKNGDYYYVPGYNVPHDKVISNASKGNKLMKKNFDGLSHTINTQILSGIRPKTATHAVEFKYTDKDGASKTLVKNIEKPAYQVCTDTLMRTAYGFSSSTEDGSTSYEYDEKDIYNSNYFSNIISKFNNKSSKLTNISDLSEEHINEYFCYRNFSEHESILDINVGVTIEEDIDEESGLEKDVVLIDDMSENILRNKVLLKNISDTATISSIQINGFDNSNANFKPVSTNDELSSSGFRLLLNEDIALHCIAELNFKINAAKEKYRLEKAIEMGYKEGEDIENYNVDLSEFDEGKFAYYHNTPIYEPSANGTEQIKVYEASYLVWTKETSESNKLTTSGEGNYIASLYYNSDIILTDETLPSVVMFEVSDKGESKNLFGNISNKINYHKSFTIYKKSYYDEKDVLFSYYTSNLEDSIEDDKKRYIALVQLELFDGTLINKTPEEFWNICKKDGLSSDNKVSIDYFDFLENSDDIFGNKNGGLKSINIVNAVEETITTEKTTISPTDFSVSDFKESDFENISLEGTTFEDFVSKMIEDIGSQEITSKYFDHNGEQIFAYEPKYETNLVQVTDPETGEITFINPSDWEGYDDEILEDYEVAAASSYMIPAGDFYYPGDSRLDAGYDKVDPETIETVSYDVDSFIMSPVYWSNKGYHTPLNYSNGIDERIRSTDKNYVVIPDHATEVILEVRHLTNTNNQIAIFAANDASQLKNIVVENPDTENPILFDNVFDIGMIPESVYTNGKLDIPVISTENNFLTPGENEKCVLFSDTNSVDVIRLPLYRSDKESGKMFALRIAGIKNMENENILIRLLGYSA